MPGQPKPTTTWTETETPGVVIGQKRSGPTSKLAELINRNHELACKIEEAHMSLESVLSPNSKKRKRSESSSVKKDMVSSEELDTSQVTLSSFLAPALSPSVSSH